MFEILKIWHCEQINSLSELNLTLNMILWMANRWIGWISNKTTCGKSLKSRLNSILILKWLFFFFHFSFYFLSSLFHPKDLAPSFLSPSHYLQSILPFYSPLSNTESNRPDFFSLKIFFFLTSTHFYFIVIILFNLRPYLDI